jgi:Trm5-related predicted tRNA methylase
MSKKESADDESSDDAVPTTPFRRSSIVVLSPDADATFPLHEPLDARAIYVVGGLCDYRRVEGATLRRAAAAAGDVVAKRLPIEDAFGTNASVNILTVNQTVEILSRVARNGGDWRAALIETLPERKLREMRARSSLSAPPAETRET